MDNKMDLTWFENNILPLISKFELQSKYFEQGDFGALHQIEFNSEEIGGNIDLWGLDWLGIFVWNYKENVELMNVLIEPENITEKHNAVEKLGIILKK